MSVHLFGTTALKFAIAKVTRRPDCSGTVPSGPERPEFLLLGPDFIKGNTGHQFRRNSAKFHGHGLLRLREIFLTYGILENVEVVLVILFLFGINVGDIVENINANLVLMICYAP
jgi:hypothetical protein